MFHKCFNGKYKNGPFFYRKTNDEALNFPKTFSQAAVELVTRLLDNNPKTRAQLGEDGAKAIKEHIFFTVSSFPLSVIIQQCI
jgi:hypothetical protein